MIELIRQNMVNSQGKSTLMRLRNVGLLAVVLTQTACAVAVIEAGGVDLLDSALGPAVDRRLQEEYRLKYPGVDVTDDYALGRAMFEEAKRNDPAQMGHLTFPSRSVWEANNAKINGGTAPASAGRSSAPVAAAAAPAVSSSRVAQDQATLKQASTPWASVSKSWPHDMLDLSSVAPYVCGIKSMQFSVNGGETRTQGFSPCSGGTAKANPPYWSFSQNSVETVSVTLTFANGSRQTRTYSRADIAKP